uniref:WD_REPEATS_REGION domain-containing protein n=1 Tax=Strongyloides papillosus TaxID=174720 RepID=A0A0N5C1Z8_STREA
MDSITLKTIKLESTWNVQNETFDSSMQTEPLQTFNRSTSPIQNISIETQTETEAVTSLSDISPSSIKINPKLIDRIIFFLKESNYINEYIKLLADLRRITKVKMTFTKTLLNLNRSNTTLLSPFSIVTGRAGRISILYGEETHDAWCNHTSKVDMYFKNQLKSIDLSSCPTKLLYHDQYAIIGQMNGQLMLAKDGDVIKIIQEHEYSISCLMSYQKDKIISTSIDGKIVMWSLKNENLIKIQDYHVLISDLPRELRHSIGKENKRRTSVVNICSINDQFIIGGETGALWSCNANDMTLIPITTVIEGIEDFIVIDNIVIILTSFGKIYKYNVKTNQIDVSPYDSIISFCNLSTRLVLLSENNIKIIDALTFEELLSEDKNFIDIKFDDNDNLVCLDTKNNINVYLLE